MYMFIFMCRCICILVTSYCILEDTFIYIYKRIMLNEIKTRRINE